MEREQFELGDIRPLDTVMRELMVDGYVPSFCTACYRLGRTGDKRATPVILQKAAQLTPESEFSHFRAVTTALETLNDPAAYWGAAAQELVWTKKWDRVLDGARPPFYRWFVGGELNTCYNAVDRHVLKGRNDQAALIFRYPRESLVVEEPDLFESLYGRAHVLFGIPQREETLGQRLAGLWRTTQ